MDIEIPSHADAEAAGRSYLTQRYLTHLQQLQLHFAGQLRAQLKPLTAAIGISESTVRNARNVLSINGVSIRPSVVNGRLTYDLREVAAALAAADAATAVPKLRPAPRPGKRGRPPKQDLAPSRQGQQQVAGRTAAAGAGGAA